MMGGERREARGERAQICAIRADGSSEIGVGHVMRCIALAQALRRKGAKACFISKDYDAAVLERIRDEGFECCPISRTASEKEDWTATLDILKSCGARALILDHYGLGEWYHRAVKESGSPGRPRYDGRSVLRPYTLTLVVDQPLLEFYRADVVLNQNADSDPKAYSVAPHTKKLFGPRYALLREEFLNYKRQEDGGRGTACRAPTGYTALVTLGGADPQNQTLKVLKAIVQVPHIARCVVTLGMAFKHRDAVLQFCKQHPHVEPIETPASMASLMAQADFAVSAAGSTCYELAYMGLPNLTLVLAPNQEGTAVGLARRGVSVNLGYYTRASLASISRAVQQLLSQPRTMTSMSRRGRRVVDGKGADRVAQVILSH